MSSFDYCMLSGILLISLFFKCKLVNQSTSTLQIDFLKVVRLAQKLDLWASLPCKEFCKDGVIYPLNSHLNISLLFSADILYFLCYPFPRATMTTGDVCTRQAIFQLATRNISPQVFWCGSRWSPSRSLSDNHSYFYQLLIITTDFVKQGWFVYVWLFLLVKCEWARSLW